MIKRMWRFITFFKSFCFVFYCWINLISRIVNEVREMLQWDFWGKWWSGSVDDHYEIQGVRMVCRCSATNLGQWGWAKREEEWEAPFISRETRSTYMLFPMPPVTPGFLSSFSDLPASSTCQPVFFISSWTYSTKLTLRNYVIFFTRFVSLHNLRGLDLS